MYKIYSNKHQDECYSLTLSPDLEKGIIKGILTYFDENDPYCEKALHEIIEGENNEIVIQKVFEKFTNRGDIITLFPANSLYKLRVIEAHFYKIENEKNVTHLKCEIYYVRKANYRTNDQPDEFDRHLLQCIQNQATFKWESRIRFKDSLVINVSEIGELEHHLPRVRIENKHEVDVKWKIIENNKDQYKEITEKIIRLPVKILNLKSKASKIILPNVIYLEAMSDKARQLSNGSLIQLS